MARTPSDAGWMLDEYDAPRFWGAVKLDGGTPYKVDPLVDQSKVTGECWAWRSSRSGDGYGRFRIGSKWFQAHRVAFRDVGKDLPDEMKLDHLCRNVGCVNPSHVEPVTHRENVMRGRHHLRNRTHCRNGHRLTTETIMDRGRGKLACRTCYGAWNRNLPPQLVA